jgi:hypothetical protein
MIETLIAILIVGILNIVCFFLGAKIGQKVSNNEPIETPTLNPFKAYQEHMDQKEVQEEMDKLEKTLANIDNYGTNKPQMKI